MTIDGLLDTLDRRGIRLWANNGKLRYRAPPGALTQDLRDTIAARRQALIERLREQPRLDNTGAAHRCMVCDPKHWVDQSPVNMRIRTVCRDCGRFIGYRPSNN